MGRRQQQAEEQGEAVKLLLESHITKAALGAIRKLAPKLEAEHLANWRGGAFLRASDAEILVACQEEQRALLTYDQATIPDLLRQWAAEERVHSGVIFADKNTVKPSSPSAVAAALARLAQEFGEADTTNMVLFLRPAQRAPG